MLILLAAPIAWPVRLMLWMLIGASLYRSLRIYVWRQGSTAIETLEMDGEGVVSVRFAGKDAWHVCQIASRFVHPWLTLLSLNIEGRRCPVSLAIVADAVEPEAFRRWRVALKLRRAPA
ncbi:MAG TPA: protein YgfX [Sulfuricaulis sp.]|nr:protein YgfX [Sulfuricaulis sp.]